MSTVRDVRELLPLYALGVLDAEDAQLVEQAALADPALAAALASYQDSTSVLVVPVAPSPAVLARLRASIGAGPLERFAARMASLFDVTVDGAREILGLVERAASWNTPMPGLGLVHFEGGPACATADCGFVRLAPGMAFPLHRHLGEEVSLILAGTLEDRRTGKRYQAGEELCELEGSEHDVAATSDGEVIYAARAINGLEVAGVRAEAPGKPPPKS